jgi:hypothetical protein
MYHPRAAAGVTLESDSEKQETASRSSMSGVPTEVEAWLLTIDRGLLQYAPIFKAHAITSLSVLGEREFHSPHALLGSRQLFRCVGVGPGLGSTAAF